MSEGDDFRSKLGSRLVFWTTIALAVLGGVIMIGAMVAELKGELGAVHQAAQLLLSTLLPLFGTWVGTVLAFYYSTQNFEAASRGTLDLVRVVAQRLSATSVSDKMMPRVKIIAETVPAGKTIEDLTIAAVDARFSSIGANGYRISRLLILDSGDICLAMLHRAIFAEMLALGLRDSPPIDPTKDLLSVLLSKRYPARPGATYGDYIRRAIAFVAQDRTVADAKAAMEQLADCQDVIVTRKGNRTEPVLGWLSNVDISRMSQA